MFDNFEWDAAKADANFRKHGITFEQAKEVFADRFAWVELDDTEAYGEDRYVIVGAVPGGILMVVYAERGEAFRIISARRANAYERRNYYRAASQE